MCQRTIPHLTIDTLDSILAIFTHYLQLLCNICSNGVQGHCPGKFTLLENSVIGRVSLAKRRTKVSPEAAAQFISVKRFIQPKVFDNIVRGSTLTIDASRNVRSLLDYPLIRINRRRNNLTKNLVSINLCSLLAGKSSTFGSTIVLRHGDVV